MKIKKETCAVQEDRSQVFLYKTPGFYAYVQKNTYPEMMPFCVTDHWHDEIEFVYITKGSIQYIVEGETMVLKKGQGLFINSRKLHVALSDKDVPCEFYCVILHPMLLCSSRHVDQTYVEPIIHNQSIKYFLFDEKNREDKVVLDLVAQIYEATQEEEYWEMKVQMLFFGLWPFIFSKGREYSEKRPMKSHHHLNTLKEMISFIQQHYQEKITLEDISNAGCVGKTMCTRLFTTYVNKTPIEFLKDYRIQQSIVLLTTTDLSITDICYETGFSSASYYGECFRNTAGCSPLEYRKENADRPISHYSRKRVN